VANASNFPEAFADCSRLAAILAIATIRAPTAGILRNARIVAQGKAEPETIEEI
jgi:hypothetical protein